jgi:hypothetical protein
MFGQDIHQWRDEAKSMQNPLLSEWYKEVCKAEKLSRLFVQDRRQWEEIQKSDMVNGSGVFEVRSKLCKQFAWAIPCECAISEIAVYEPLLEIGAGTGYWASLLRSRGIDILACDIAPPNLIENYYHVKMNYTEVLTGGPEILDSHALHNGRTLMLCWPPYSDPMAYDCLRRYQGKYVIYIGEYQGCCAEGQFFELLEKNYKEVKTVEIPKFDSIHDYLTVFQRHAEHG